MTIKPTMALDKSGMTLRDYFAAVALPAVYAQHVAVGGDMQDSIAEECYELADAMLVARTWTKAP